jgi:hypothetical protein
MSRNADATGGFIEEGEILGVGIDVADHQVEQGLPSGSVT